MQSLQKGELWEAVVGSSVIWSTTTEGRQEKKEGREGGEGREGQRKEEKDEQDEHREDGEGKQEDRMEKGKERQSVVPSLPTDPLQAESSGLSLQWS